MHALSPSPLRSLVWLFRQEGKMQLPTVHVHRVTRRPEPARAVLVKAHTATATAATNVPSLRLESPAHPLVRKSAMR